MPPLDELLTSENEVAIVISFNSFYVEVSKESVTLYDPSKERDSDAAILASLSRDNFDDVIRACEAIPSL